MNEKRIQCWSKASQHVPIYLQPFTSYSEQILVGNCNIFMPLHLMFSLKFREKFGPQKTRIMELPGSEDSLTIGWAVSTQYQRVTDGQTDRQTDVQPISITCAVILTHVKNQWRRSVCKKWLSFPPHFLPSFSPPSLPSLPPREPNTPYIQSSYRGSGERWELPQRVLTKPGRLTLCGTYNELKVNSQPLICVTTRILNWHCIRK